MQTERLRDRRGAAIARSVAVFQQPDHQDDQERGEETDGEGLTIPNHDALAMTTQPAM